MEDHRKKFTPRQLIVNKEVFEAYEKAIIDFIKDSDTKLQAQTESSSVRHNEAQKKD